MKIRISYLDNEKGQAEEVIQAATSVLPGAKLQKGEKKDGYNRTFLTVKPPKNHDLKRVSALHTPVHMV